MTSDNTPLLMLDQVEKTYPGAGSGGFRLGPVQLNVAKGATVGIMGRNGAGKTTLFQIITGNIDRTGGQMQFGGHPHGITQHECKRQIGYLPQDPVLPRWATADELLRYAATLYGLPNARRAATEAMEQWDVTSFQHNPIGACSYGMQKRIGLALATVHNPALLVVDEPFSGLDLFHVRALEETLVNRAKRGQATIVSTHVPLHIAALATSLVLVRNGQVSEIGRWGEMNQSERIAQIEKAFFT